MVDDFMDIRMTERDKYNSSRAPCAQSNLKYAEMSKAKECWLAS